MWERKKYINHSEELDQLPNSSKCTFYSSQLPVCLFTNSVIEQEDKGHWDVKD